MTPVSHGASPNRFYEAVHIERAKSGHAILLDSKPVLTPTRSELVVPTESLAKAVAGEWEAQGERIDPEAMPLTKRANTALDQVRVREAEVVEEIVAYAGSDLLCYRAESPDGLIELQRSHWDPVLEWVRAEFGADFKTCAGISHVTQPQDSLVHIRRAFAAHDFFQLAPLHAMATLTGSALLAHAHARGRLSADEVWAAAHVDEDWQNSQWGEDAEATVRRAARRAEFDADSRFLELLHA